MIHKYQKFVLHLGGSVLCPNGVDINYLKRFYSFIKKQLSKKRKFVIVVGGGSFARRYQALANNVTTKVSDSDKDWIGIEATKINAVLLRAVFGGLAHPLIFDKRYKIKRFGRYPIIIGSGWKPGWSTDFDAFQIALDFKIKKVIILSETDYIYTANPHKSKNAKIIRETTWKEYMDLIPRKWMPGLKTPIDPVAARLAQKRGLEAIEINGRNLSNFENLLDGKNFKGTVVH